MQRSDWQGVAPTRHTRLVHAWCAYGYKIAGRAAALAARSDPGALSIAFSRYDRTYVARLDLATGRAAVAFSLEYARDQCLAFSPDGRWLLRAVPPARRVEL